MSYQNYVIAAYVVFVLAMLWDWLSPQVQTRQQLRAARLRARRTPDASRARHSREPREGADSVP
jgi:heme exporter protein D